MYILFGNKHIIELYRSNVKALLQEDPYEFTVQRYESLDHTKRIIETAINYECYTEIGSQEYSALFNYLNKSLHLIFNSRLLEVSKPVPRS